MTLRPIYYERKTPGTRQRRGWKNIRNGVGVVAKKRMLPF
jgi:hypothetical protein